MAIGTTAAIIGASAVGAGASIASSRSQASAARNATEAQVDAADANAALQREIYYQNREDLTPAREYEQQQLNAMGELFGFSPVGQTNSGQQQRPPRNNLATMFGAESDYAGLGGADGAYRYGGGQLAQVGYADSSATAGATPTTSTQGNALARFEASPFMTVAMNDYELADDNLSAAMGAQGLEYSSARLNAREDTRANVFGQQFNNYLSTLMGSAPQQATNAMTSNANNYLAGASANNTAVGNAMAQGAYAQGNAAAAGASGVANAGMWGVGAYGGSQGWF